MPNRTSTNDGFMECATCDAKPGSPTLCHSCLHNRTTINDAFRVIQELATYAIKASPPCKRCGKGWCGTDLKTLKVHGDPVERHVTYGSKKCRNKGSKR